MQYRAWFSCVAGCPGQHPLNEVLYRCPICGALLEVTHDEEGLRSRSAAAWMRLFDERYLRTRWPYGSGVWGKKEWVQPHIADENVVSLFEGGTNLFWAERYGKQLGVEDLWVKQCGTSHTGSFKDLGMTVLVSTVRQMRAEGKPIRAVACASTGDTSAALAAYGAAAGIPVVVLLPANKITAAQLIQPVANGAMVCSLDTDFDGCMKVVQRLTDTSKGDTGIYLANSMNSLRVEGQKTIAFEIVQQFDWEVPDWVLVPGGNLGNVSAIAKGFLEMQRMGLIAAPPRLVCCQAAQANPLFLAYERARAAGRDMSLDDFEAVQAQPTLASAIQIGNPVSLSKAVKAIVETRGMVLQATEEQLAHAVARADRTGLFSCPHTGVALACLEQLIESNTIQKQDRVVVISTAHGLKFTEFKAGYHRETLGFESRLANHPVSMTGDPEQAVGELHRLLDDYEQAN
ncbi:threonine synthase precursor [Plesiocystis pacifica SIR-1]|uniref:Threonine synthase n=1 Tax=Plesiocystis pacifica SIR-1 TaxID=391625 RepID=A6GE93_9BACT|nr:threonine synthase [Plesiocystis pacifica]EDM75811.1 threonine synthase precursor [Plesiocystis pacifica SIR-1]